ncbi:MAG: FMN-binding negative transcriptional regulator [Aquincola sp.]|nr:FMN-binding negative transcriptional regulator [Aquincola sp.]MDH5328609.1 FMN-binding negative transcriptional regulator [Aquincola sp.]
MYLPKHFEQSDRGALAALMRERPLATLIVCAPDGPTADLIPLEYEPGAGAHGTLRGHVARANPLWRHAGAQALAVFTGPESYVSPGWYPSKREHGKVVPTWNYTMVQARGVLAAVDDAPWLRALVGRLTDQHESRQAQPWSVNDAPDDYVLQMLRAIVGIEIPLASLVGKWKVSQNRSAADREGVAQALAPNDAAMSALVRGA